MLLLVVAALTLEATSLVQYYFAKKSIIEIASKRADDNLENSKVDILNILNQVETAIRNDIWMVLSSKQGHHLESHGTCGTGESFCGRIDGGIGPRIL